jgi:ribosomal protein S18 acetylase RimI-like enzyme
LTEITLARPEEYDWAARLMASSEPWLTLGRDLDACIAYLGPHADGELLVARDGEVPLGLAYVRPRGFAGSPYVASIGVAPQYRGAGVGTALLRHVESRYAPPARHVFLLVSSFNDDARRLYQRLGYQPIGDIPDYIVTGSSETIMHKPLA